MKLLSDERRTRIAEPSGFERRLGYAFADGELLTLALTHRSWCAEHPDAESNERLEFLGDAVLGLAVTEALFSRFPDLAEGQLAKIRAAVVSATPLATVGASLDLAASMRLGKGVGSGEGGATPAILADAMEAVIGAVYLDGGLDAVRELVLRLFTPFIDQAAEGPGEHDHKTQLQELGARLFDELPTYELRGEGPDHDKRFHAAVRLGGQVLGRGEGRSKKAAEQAAAEAALRHLSQSGHDARESADA